MHLSVITNRYSFDMSPGMGTDWVIIVRLSVYHSHQGLKKNLKNFDTNRKNEPVRQRINV
jgi:hypothetical protein